MMRRFRPAVLIAGMVIILTALVLLFSYMDGKAQQSVDEATWSSVKAMFHEPPEFPDLAALDWEEGEIHEYVNDKGQRVTLKCWQVNGWWVCITLAHEPEIAELTGWENYDFLGDLDRPHIGGPRP